MSTRPSCSRPSEPATVKYGDQSCLDVLKPVRVQRHRTLWVTPSAPLEASSAVDSGREEAVSAMPNDNVPMPRQSRTWRGRRLG